MLITILPATDVRRFLTIIIIFIFHIIIDLLLLVAKPHLIATYDMMVIIKRVIEMALSTILAIWTVSCKQRQV